jgi:hypothetical protein
MAQESDLGIKTDELPLTTEAKVFYLTNCLRQFDYVKAQQDSGIVHPKNKLELEYVRQYYQNNVLCVFFEMKINAQKNFNSYPLSLFW